MGAFVDLDRDGKPELLVWQSTGGAVFKEGPDGWRKAGHLEPFCQDVADAIRAGQVTAKRPTQDDIDVGGARLHVLGDQSGLCITSSPVQVGQGKPPPAPAPAHAAHRPG